MCLNKENALKTEYYNVLLIRCYSNLNDEIHILLDTTVTSTDEIDITSMKWNFISY